MEISVPANCINPTLVCRAWMLALVFTAPSLYAQSLDYGALEELFAEPVTTSVTGSPQRASNVPATMEIITADDIRRSGARDIPGVLRNVTGIDSLRWSNSSVDVGIRGYNKVLSSRVLVLLNGRQVYVDHYGYTPWSTIPVEMDEIRQIEVVKGPNSALFGFNAVGGVINIVTYNPLYDDVDFVTARSGTQSHREVSAGWTFDVGTLGKAKISAGGRRNDTFSTPAGLIKLGMSGDEERNSLRFDTHFPLSPTMEFSVEASWINARQAIMIPSYTMALEDMTVRSLKAELGADTQLGLISATVYRNWIDDDFIIPAYRRDLPSGFGSTTGTLDSQMTLVQLQDIFKIGSAHTLRFTGEYRESQLQTFPYAGATVSYDVYSGGVMWNWQLAPTLAVTSALRNDRLELGRSGFVPSAQLGITNAAWDRTLDESSFNVGMVWNAGSNDVIRLVAARGAQLPNLYDLGGNLNAIPTPPAAGLPPVLFVSGRPELQPTTVNNVEVAWDRTFPGTGTELNVALFRGTTDDVVAGLGRFDLNAGIINAPANVGGSTSQGLEVMLKGNFGNQWRWRLGYIHQDIDDELNGIYPEWRTVTNFEETTPRHIVNASIGWTGENWELDAFMRFQSAFEGFRQTPELIIDPAIAFLGIFSPITTTPDLLFPVSSYTTLDIRAGRKLGERVSLSLTGRNLLRREQRLTAGLPVERSILGTVQLSF